MARYAIVMDTRSCIGCHSCTVACKVHNELPTDMVYNPVVQDGPHGTFPNLHSRFLPLICMHCDNSPCVDACPTGASVQREDGIVHVEDKNASAVCPVSWPVPMVLVITITKLVLSTSVTSVWTGWIRARFLTVLQPATRKPVFLVIWMMSTVTFTS